MNTTKSCYTRCTRRFLALTCVLAPLAAPKIAQAQSTQPSSSLPQLRPPSVPLIAHDPYFSVWSPSETLASANSQHWTGSPHPISSLIRIDGQSFRLLGATPANVPALEQKSLQVLPTRTIATYGNAQVLVTLTFLSPALPSDLDVLSRPVTYVTWNVRSVDGRPHAVQAYFDASAMLAVNEAAQKITGATLRTGRSKDDVQALRISSVDQPVLQAQGDNQRIDWGHLLLAAPGQGSQVLGPRADVVGGFVQSGSLRGSASLSARAAGEGAPVAAVSLDMGRVGARGASRAALIGYDDEYSVRLMGRQLRPYWRRNGAGTIDLLRMAARDYASLSRRSVLFDDELMADLRATGGEKYARLAALAHRQALAAQKVVADANGAPLSFSKENNSGGFIATVDVMYPAAPQMMMLSPTLLKATLEPVMLYSSGPRWPFPFPPHDMGVYPKATGMLYGGGENIPANGDVSSKMPVEESGNMLILLAAVAKIEGHTRYADRYWPAITKWANYLISKGYDLDNQLSTDDFSGHLAHNVNLSGKSIVALGAYAQMAQMRGDTTEARRVRGIAEGMVRQWMEAARDGDHFRIAFDRPSTWSQKYNLIWDSVLDINLFPDSVTEQEVAFYKTKQNRYGLPLDSRDNYTKLDWIIWSGSLSGRKDDLMTLVDPVYLWLNETTSRVPMTDFYRTIAGTQVGFMARSVVGGVFMPVLNNRAMWRKWAARDLAAARSINLNWAPLPPTPQITEVVPPSAKSGAMWSYTTTQPTGNWFAPNYDASSWQTGQGGLGAGADAGTVVGTEWRTPDIWARREFTLTQEQLANRDTLQLLLYHDENAEAYLNGVPAANVSGYNSAYEPFPISVAARATLKPGRNVFAEHVQQTRGGQYIDMGLANVR